MTILPVLDILNGQVVRGIAGRRSEYRPLQSPLAETSAPLDIAQGLRRVYGLCHLYVADLDGLLHNQPRLDVIEQLRDDGFRLLVDNGVRTVEQGLALRDAGAVQVIAALEVLDSPAQLAKLVEALGTDGMTFSLDLKKGRPMTESPAWPLATPLTIARCAIDCGVTSMIVLDLHAVGQSAGLATLPLCREIRSQHSHVYLVTGGGVRNMDDIQSAAQAGVDSLLVSTVLHSSSSFPVASLVSHFGNRQK